MEEPGFRSLGVLHPTFEVWGGAEWFIHQSLQRMNRRFGIRSVIYTHRWRPPPGEKPGYQVVAHRRGGVATGPWDWRRIAGEQAGRWRTHDRLWLHNHPAALWYGHGLERGALPPALWYCHEPPRHLFDPEPPPGGPRGSRPATAALHFYGARAPARLWSRLRLATARRTRGGEGWIAELRRRDREAVARVPALVANSRYTAGRVRELYGRSAEVVYPLPADLPELAPRPGQRKEPMVLWVGRMTAAKRPRLLLRAWRRALAAQPGLRSHRLVFVGDGPERPDLEREAGGEGLAGTVTLRRALRRAEMIDLYRAALLCVHLGVEEPFGLVPLEAMAAGTAVLAAAGGGVGETVLDGSTGWCVSGLDRDRLAARLARLPEDHDELRRVGRRAARHVRERFDPDDALRRLLGRLDRAGEPPPA